LVWGQKLRFLRILKYAQHRNFSSPTDFKISELLNNLSYRGIQITVENRRTYSMTLVFSSWSDSSHISIRIKIFNCCSQSSQIWLRCQNFCFKVFWVDSRMPTCHDISITWCGVYLISVIALFTRWVSSRWLYLWCLNRVVITLKPPWTLWINLRILQLLRPIKRYLIVSPSLIGSARPIIILISPSLYTLDP
jgi:hypothetical protein